jgi:hypothetical protein
MHAVCIPALRRGTQQQTATPAAHVPTRTDQQAQRFVPTVQRRRIHAGERVRVPGEQQAQHRLIPPPGGRGRRLAAERVRVTAGVQVRADGEGVPCPGSKDEGNFTRQPH